VTAKTLRCSSLSGRLIEVSKSSISGVRPITIQRLPALLIESNKFQGKLFMYTLGLNRDSVYTRLCELIGPDHIVTQALRPM
jgi:hypothetical protein